MIGLAEIGVGAPAFLGNGVVAARVMVLVLASGLVNIGTLCASFATVAMIATVLQNFMMVESSILILVGTVELCS